MDKISERTNVVENIEIIPEANNTQKDEESVFQKDSREFVNNTIKPEEEECSCKKGGSMNSNEECSCKKGNAMMQQPNYIFALGRITFEYPNESVRYEVALSRAAEGIDASIGDREGLYRLLSGDLKNQYLYLSRQICWLYTIGNTSTYILIPGDPFFYDLFIQTLAHPPSRPFEIISNEPILDNIVGVKGAIGTCANVILPMVRVDRLKTIRVEDVRNNIRSIADDSYNSDMRISQDEYRTSMSFVLDRMLQFSENEGATDGQRALNFLTLNSRNIYTEILRIQSRENAVLDNVVPTPPRMIGNKKIVDVVFYFRSQEGLRTFMYAISVNVTGEFPFLQSPFRLYSPPFG